MPKHMTGLRNFINEILEFTTRYSESERVNIELAKIRKVFGSSEKLSGYNRKKYVGKLLFIHLTGYRFDFGYQQILDLLASHVFSEKQMGYIAIQLISTENYEMVPMLVGHFLKEIGSSNPTYQCMAMVSAANIGGKELAERLSPFIFKALINPKHEDRVKECAALSLAGFCRFNSDVLNDFDYDKLSSLMRNGSYKVQSAIASLILSMFNENRKLPETVFRETTLLLIDIISKPKHEEKDKYFGVPNPWLQSKLLRVLMLNQDWNEGNKKQIESTLDLILMRAIDRESIHELNAGLMPAFDAADLMLSKDINKENAQKFLMRMANSQRRNVRFAALEVLTKNIYRILPIHRSLYKDLDDEDYIIRRRTLSLLFAMCNKENFEEISFHLIRKLKSDDNEMKEPISIKLSILAERFAKELPSWYVSTIFTLLTYGAQYLGDDVWFKAASFISENKEIQEESARKANDNLFEDDKNTKLSSLCISLIGDYSELVVLEDEVIVDELCAKYRNSKKSVQVIILSALFKIGIKSKPVRGTILKFFDSNQNSKDISIMQRSLEFSTVLRLPSDFVDLATADILTLR